MYDEYKRGASDYTIGCHSLLFVVVCLPTRPAGRYEGSLVHHAMSMGAIPNCV